MLSYPYKDCKPYFYLSKESEQCVMDANEKKLAAEARNAYAREWRAKNPDKVRKNNANYWLRKAGKAALENKEDRRREENLDA